MKNSDSELYILYAGVCCKLIIPIEWRKYFIKLYDKSSVLTVLEKEPKNKSYSVLKISTVKSAGIKMTIQPSRDLTHFDIRATDAPIFLFPSVHQFICRILNIEFHRIGGFVLHASSIYVKNKTLIFMGESGRGKSTIVDYIDKYIDKSIIISDNSAFIKKIGNNFYLFPSPYFEANRVSSFHGQIHQKKPYKINTVYCPFHAKNTKIVDLTFQEKVRLLQGNSHIPISPKKLFSPQELARFGNITFNFLNSVEMYKLEFAKTKSFIYDILSKKS